MVKKNNLIFYISSTFLLIILAILFIFGMELKPSDELWNFNNIYKMYNGFEIYKDTNVIITPLFFYLSEFFFHIFTPNILVFRIFNILNFVLIYMVIYKILRNLKISKELSLIFLSLIFLETFSLITCGANYNFLAILFVLLGINEFLKEKPSNFIHGLLMFLIFFIKQSIGVYYIIGMILFEICSKGFTKLNIINLLKRLLYFTIFSSILLLIFYFKGILLDFISFAFGGLFEFSQKNFYFSASPNSVVILIIGIILYCFIFIKKKTLLKNLITKNIENNLNLLFVFSLLLTLTIFPLINEAHVQLLLPFYLILICYIFYILILEDIFKDSKNLKLFSYLFTVIILLVCIGRTTFEFYKTLSSSSYINNQNSPFYGILITNEYIEKNDILKSYILEKKNLGTEVLILSYDSGYVVADLKQNNGVYDLLFNGNLGYNGIEKIQKDLLQKNNIELLILTDESDLHFQESLEIRNFIIENFKYKGELCNYSIYTK